MTPEQRHALRHGDFAPDLEMAEATNPETPGERLREIVNLRTYVDLRTSEEARRAMALHDAAIGNPSLPFDLLGATLQRPDVRWCPVAWNNPAVALLLQIDPRPEYEHAAHLLLKSWSPWTVRGMRFRELVAWWSEFEMPVFTMSSDERAYYLARRFADLFGFPWR